MKQVVTFLVAAFFSVAAIADTITGNLLVNPNLAHIGSGATTLRETIDTIQSWTFTTNGAAQIKEFVVHSGTLAGGKSTNYDLTAQTDSFGQSVVFKRLKFLSITTSTTNMTFIGLGGANSNAFTNWVGDTSDIIKIPPGSGSHFFTATTNGYVVSNLVSDLLCVTNCHATSNANYTLMLGGNED